jgi:HSP20 family protein
MTLLRWSPFRETDLLRESINRIFDESVLGCDVSSDCCTYSPAVDIRETDEAIGITADLPGIDMKDIDIHVEGGVLTIAGEKKCAADAKEGEYHRSERAFGRFERSFTLPQTVVQDSIDAVYKDGVLTVSLPKTPEAKPKKIDVKSAG